MPIKTAIKLLRSFEYSDDQIIEALMDSYGLTEVDARTVLAEH